MSAMITAVARYASSTSSTICAGFASRSGLDRHGHREPRFDDRLQVLLDRRHAAPRRKVTVDAAVAVGDVHMTDHALEHRNVVERRARQVEMRYVGVSLHRWVIDRL